jgi:uncharacterized protein YecE (DUF72 family)
MARHWIGTSGWSYANWRGTFYPKGLKPAEWLPHYARHLSSVELNASFYRLPSEAMLKGFVARTPDTFLFAIKGSRLITHLKRLRDCEEALATFLARIDLLGARGGPVLFQLPPNFPAEPARLGAFLALLPAGRRFAFEFRDPSWHDEAVYERLRSQGAAFVPFDLAGLCGPRVVTSDFVYVRLHGHQRRYRGAYDPALLQDWAAWLRAQLAEGRDVHVYFDNTDEADHAVRDATRLDALLAGAAPGSE